ncbi:MAG TPA: Ig-like domain-containing protein [Gaiellaceae bacterium]|nr:Ig-like domain-containing protein [Gaiellaceae bacterium]
MSLRRIVTGLLAGACALVWAATAAASPSGVVVSQVYGGGGNAGSPLQRDFIELYNAGSSPVSLAGWSVQYASATGSGFFGANSSQLTELSGSIAPGGYVLVEESGGATGSPLPTPDVVDATPINMSASAGKVALVRSTTSLGCNGSSAQPCGAAQLALIEDLVGYGNANFFEGSGPAPTLSNTTAALRGGNGAIDTDNNASDFAAGAPSPRNSSFGQETAPSVSSTSPAAGASDVALDANVEITFSEDVAVTGDWYSISCTVTGAHTATVSGGPRTFTLDPSTDFGGNETCTVTVAAAGVTDTDTTDPPDSMAADHVFGFSTLLPLTEIAQVQGAGHLSPLNGQLVKVEGVVVAERGSNVWIQDATPDADPATSEGILVFGSSVAGAVAVGDLVQVRGTVTEFRPGCTPSCDPAASAFDNLTITELSSPGVGVTVLGTAPLPAATVIGAGGRVPPTEVIEDDATTGNVETSNVFDPAQDGLDFYETLESMRVRVNDPVVVGPRNGFGEILVLADDGAAAGIRTTRGGIVIRPGDFNPERVMLDDLILPTPAVDVRDHFTQAATGVMTYDFANYKIAVTEALTAVDGGLQREVTTAPAENQLSVATFNVENLDPSDVAAIPRLAAIVVDNLRSPDLIGIEEMQDNTGARDDGTTDASLSWQAFIAAIQAAGGPAYEYRQIDPEDKADGGQPGGNIRVGFLFRTDRGLSFVDRPGGDAVTPTDVFRQDGGAHLSLSPGRVDPLNPAWDETRKPLAGEFRWNDKTLIAIVNHFSSKSGDDPLFGRFQPPVRSSEVARHQQAASVNAFVDRILAVERKANVIVLGDINDFEFSETTEILAGGGVLTSLVTTLPQPERYSYVFEGNSQVLDQILFSENMLRGLDAYDVVHVNAEFADQASDHDPSVARTKVLGGGGGAAGT